MELMEEDKPDMTDCILQQPLQESWTSVNLLNGQQEDETAGTEGGSLPPEAEQWEQLIWPVRPISCSSPRLSFATVQWDAPDAAAETPEVVTDERADGTNPDDAPPSTCRPQDGPAELSEQEERAQLGGFDSQPLDSDLRWTGNCAEPCDAAEEREESTHQLLHSNHEIRCGTNSEEDEEPSDQTEDGIDAVEENRDPECQGDSSADVKAEEEREESDTLLTEQLESEEDEASADSEELEEEDGEFQVDDQQTSASRCEESEEENAVDRVTDQESTSAELLQADDVRLSVNPDAPTDLLPSEVLEENPSSDTDEDLTCQSDRTEMCVGQKVDPEQSKVVDGSDGASIQVAENEEKVENCHQIIQEIEDLVEVNCLECHSASQDGEASSSASLQSESSQGDMTENPEQISAQPPQEERGDSQQLQESAEVELTDRSVWPETAESDQTEQTVRVGAEESESDQTVCVEAEESDQTVCVEAEESESDQTVCVEAEESESDQTVHVGAEESDQTVRVGAEESDQTVCVGAEESESDQTVCVGAEESDQTVCVGAEESDQTVRVGAEESDQTVCVGAEESDQTVCVGAEESDQTVCVGAEESDQTVRVGAEESDQTVRVGAEEPAVMEQQPVEQKEPLQTADSPQPVPGEQLEQSENESEVAEQLSEEAEVTLQAEELSQVDEQHQAPHQAQDLQSSQDTDAHTVLANGASPHMNGGEGDREKAQQLAERLFKLDGIQRADVVKHLDKDNDFSRAVGEEYLRFFDFTGQSLDQALRSFLKVVVLIGETQERERVLQHFSCRFHQCNPDCFDSSGAALALTCALMLLNTDLHGQHVGKSMSSSKFVSNLDEMNEGGNFSKDLLKSLYNSIKSEPLQWAVDEEELKSAVLPEEDAPLHSKANPFQDVPRDKKAAVVKRGVLQRKLHADIDGKRTPWGRRSWKSFFGVLKGMVLYLLKDDVRGQSQTHEEVVSVHHSLAEPAADYTKKPYVFRLQTADWRVFLFQASSKLEMNSWINRINLISALHSSPPFPAAVGSQRRFCRPILPASQSAHTLDRQLQFHTRMLESFKEDLSSLQKNQPEGRKAKARDVEEHRVRAEYLHYEVYRYETYLQVLQGWGSVQQTSAGALSGAALKQFDKALCAEPPGEEEDEEEEEEEEQQEEAGMKRSHSSPSLEVDAALPQLVKVRRNISERRTYRRIIVPRRNKEA